MIGVDLHLEPNEASDLCSVHAEDPLRKKGWDRALLTVLDEATAEDALALLVHSEGSPLDEGWEALRVRARPSNGAKGKTEDSEACARRDGMLYWMGSQFGKKAGPLSARRSWIARVGEHALAEAVASGSKVDVEIARVRFGFHRAVNDALAAAAIDLLPLGPLARKNYIDDTIAAGAKKNKRWAGRVQAGDQPLNVEAMEFRADGRLLLGLRYPVTADGHPILVEVHDVEAIFEDPDALPRCGAVWVLEDVGTAAEPAGFRALDSAGDDRFDAIVGDLDAANKSATVLEDHPQGGRACSEHRRFELPLTAAGGPVTTELVHHFGDVRRVEGVAVDHEGHSHYVIDEEGHVALRTLMVD